jgi:hypothetical protein
MIRFLFLLLTIASSTAAIGQTMVVCPWLTSGTAATLLGGDVTVEAHVEGDSVGACRFARKRGDSTASIEILVDPTDTHPCPQDNVQLKSLGNEAVQCRRTTLPAQHFDIVAGRIRNIYFAITLTGVPDATRQEPGDPRLSDAYGASPLERAAEQVVGNLY